MKIIVKMRGTCGELAQGFYRGEHVLITCPIEKFSTAVVSDEFAGVFGLGLKSRAILDKVCGGREFKFGLRLASELPRGKGMASSSADMAAVAQAVALSLGRRLSPGELGKLCASIEPTDGIFYPGVVAMNPLTGRLIKNIRAQERFQVAVFDYGGTVDTVDTLKLNRRSDFEFPTLANEIDFTLTERSALANQSILPKRGLEDLMTFAKDLGAVAVNVAHSGTVAGIFFHAEDSHAKDKVAAVRRRFDFLDFMTLTRLAV